MGTGDERELIFDPAFLTERQRAGRSCVVCHKSWPRPREDVGRLPDGARLYACRSCAAALPPAAPPPAGGWREAADTPPPDRRLAGEIPQQRCP
ncbi:hypothetical protein [Actinomadura craniellae]|nr:hypothetical protein [Actinomadura craniellae]